MGMLSTYSGECVLTQPQARYPVFLGLTQLVEADPSQAKVLVPAMHKFVGLMHSMLADNYTGYVFHSGDNFDALWGRAREQDMIISLQWLLEKYPEGNSQILWESMELLLEQAYDWAYWYSEGVFIKVDLNTVPADLTKSLYQFEHGVNAAQGKLYPYPYYHISLVQFEIMQILSKNSYSELASGHGEGKECCTLPPFRKFFNVTMLW